MCLLLCKLKLDFLFLSGLADGAGVDYVKLRGIHMIGEVTQGKCSMYGSWEKLLLMGKHFKCVSKRTFHKLTRVFSGHVRLLRRAGALDWDTDSPFTDYPAVVVYHPKNLGHPFANVGFLGWIGGLTGQSSKKLAISEIGVAYPDSTFGEESRVGIPFTFLLRDILQFDNSYEVSIILYQVVT